MKKTRMSLAQAFPSHTEGIAWRIWVWVLLCLENHTPKSWSAARRATAPRARGAADSIPSGAKKAAKIACSRGGRTHQEASPATLRHKRRANQSQPSIHPFPSCFPALVPPPRKALAEQQLSQETDQDCQGLTPITILHAPSFGDFLEIHMAVGAAARPTEGCAM